MSQLTTICLLHGHGVDATIWGDIDASISGVGPVFAPDFAHVATHQTIDEYAELLNKHLRAEVGTAGQIVLVGHSMGGYIALAFAERYPDRVGGLVLYHSTAYADDAAKKAQRRQAIDSLRTEGAAPFIEKQLPKMVAPGYAPEKVQALISQFRRLPADALSAGMEAMATRPDRTHVLREATFPVLLLLGREDQILPHDRTAQLATLSPRISVVTLEGAGHLSMIEQPDEAINALLGFVGQLPGVR